MNAKLVALYKQFPWLITLKDEIRNPSVVKVARLDIESIQRRCGTIATSDDYYWIRGYFFNNGAPCGTIRPNQGRGLFAKLKQWFSKDICTIETAARIHPMKDEITDVVLFGHDLNHYGSLQLYVYRLPKGKTMSDLLEELDLARLEQDRLDRIKATEEVAQELEQVN